MFVIVVGAVEIFAVIVLVVVAVVVHVVVVVVVVVIVVVVFTGPSWVDQVVWHKTCVAVVNKNNQEKN